MFKFKDLFRMMGKTKTVKPHKISLVKRQELFEILTTFWPKLDPHRVYLADRNYVLPPKEDVLRILKESQIDKFVHTAGTIGADSGLFDCDDFSLLLQAFIIRKRYEDFQKGKIPKNQLFPLAFGQIWYQEIMGSHAINICVTRDEGIVLIEPQTDKVWQAEQNITIDFLRF